jgi:thiamine kinase
MSARRRAEQELRARLADDARTRMLASAALVPVIGGLSNFAWRANGEFGDWFLRLARPGTEQLGADHVNECRVLECAAAGGFAPSILRCDPAARVLVTRWVAAPESIAATQHGISTRAMAGLLARLHATAAPGDLQRVDFEARARALAAVVRDAGPLQSLASRVFASLAAAPVPAVLCHNDLNPANVVRDAAGRWWLVDWEYAGCGDPAFDLASFASQHELGPDALEALVDEYRAAGGHIGTDRLTLARWAFDYVQWLWYRAFPGSEAWPEPTGLAARADTLAAALHERASGLPHCNN